MDGARRHEKALKQCDGLSISVSPAKKKKNKKM
jgi:hypothetical protein